jgi:glucose-1-phosphate thymidylyltransferase
MQSGEQSWYLSHRSERGWARLGLILLAIRAKLSGGNRRFCTQRSKTVSNSVNKVVILAAGLGKRMRKSGDGVELDDHEAAAADTGVKAMIPIDRPFLDYVLSEVAAAGFTEVCLVIGPEHDQVRQYYENEVDAKQLRFSFAIQHDRLGTADALAKTEAFAEGEPVVMLNSDNYYPRSALAGLRQLDGPGLAVFDRAVMLESSNIASERLQAFAMVETDAEGMLEHVHEKPAQATVDRLGPHAGLSLNCWRFSPRIYEACQAIEPSQRGEYEITDAVQHAIDQFGERFGVVHCDEPVLDLSRREDIPAVAERLRQVPCAL